MQLTKIYYEREVYSSLLLNLSTSKPYLTERVIDFVSEWIFIDKGGLFPCKNILIAKWQTSFLISRHSWQLTRYYKILIFTDINQVTGYIVIGLGLGPQNSQKKEPAQPEWPKQDRKILGRCMSRSAYKPQTPSEDKVAVLWSISTAHKPRYMKGLMPSR